MLYEYNFYAVRMFAIVYQRLLLFWSWMGTVWAQDYLNCSFTLGKAYI